MTPSKTLLNLLLSKPLAEKGEILPLINLSIPTNHEKFARVLRRPQQKKIAVKIHHGKDHIPDNPDTMFDCIFGRENLKSTVVLYFIEAL